MTRKYKNQPKNRSIRIGLTGLSVLILLASALLVQPAGASPSGQNLPTGDLDGWKQIFAEDFTKDAATGSFASDCDPNKIVYTGATGTKWAAYPKCYTDTTNHRPYRSDAVLSVHDGTLDFYLHTVEGQPAGANPSPLVDGTSQYQTYGRYSARIKVDASNLSDYYAAWLLWPANDANWQYAESDFPEGGLDTTGVKAFAHYGGSGSQDIFNTTTNFYSGWHTFTQDWVPGKRSYYIDGILVGTSTNQVFSQPERWQLQTETVGSGTSSGHLYVDWVSVYAYSPGTKATVVAPPSSGSGGNTGSTGGSTATTGSGSSSGSSSPTSKPSGGSTGTAGTETKAPATAPTPATQAVVAANADTGLEPLTSTIAARPQASTPHHHWWNGILSLFRNLF